MPCGRGREAGQLVSKFPLDECFELWEGEAHDSARDLLDHAFRKQPAAIFRRVTTFDTHALRDVRYPAFAFICEHCFDKPQIYLGELLEGRLKYVRAKILACIPDSTLCCFNRNDSAWI